jgi:molybdate transport system ATP-binding protein
MLKVDVQYHRDGFALRAQFCAPTPGVVALFGRSGSGKSTLISVIAGLLRGAAGEVRLDEVALLDSTSGLSVPPEQRRVGYVFQDARLFPHLSVRGNLRYAERRAAAGAIEFSAVCDLLGLERLLERRVQGLSGGERQRVAIGRALLSQPNLLLLDEPLASLDASRREEVLPYLENLRDRLSIPMVYVSHDFDEVWRLATHLVLIDGGQTVAEGSLAAMSLHPGLRAIIGAESVGAIVDGVVLGQNAAGLTRVAVGQNELHIEASEAPPASRVRVQLLARDIIVATKEAQHLSVRNSLKGTVCDLQEDGASALLVTIDIGGAWVVSRITRAAGRDLALVVGTPVWALVKSVSLRRAVLSRT